MNRENELKAFMKSNKERREKLALKNGYSSVAEYRAYLEAGSDDSERTIVTNNSTKPIIHVIDVVDCSSSMNWGNKIQAATLGVNDGVTDMKKNTEVDFRYSLLTFSYRTNIKFKVLKASIGEVNNLQFATGGNTALYDAVGKAITTFKDVAEKGEKVLINVYTDGEENESKVYTKHSIGKLIEEVSNIITVTFIGTEVDTKNVIRDMNIHYSNTLSYDGTAEGLAKSINSTIDARTVYASNVSQGNDVRTGFYKEVVVNK